MKLGILGGGQLAQMLCEAAQTLSPDHQIETLCLADAPDCPASHVSPIILIDFNNPDFSDNGPLAQFVSQVDAITYEWENIPLNITDWLSERCTLHPASQVLATSQDRLFEKQLMVDLGIPVPPFSAINEKQDLEKAVAELGLPLVMKTRRGGYDGKGQYVLKHGQDITAAWEALGSVDTIVEQFVPFDREVSLITTQGLKEDSPVFYPLTENFHKEGILRLSLAPFEDSVLQTQAQDIARKLISHFHYIGTLAIEFFVCGDKLLVNEIAPRVHNSGHWTIEGAKASQFENHVRAVCGLPLALPNVSGYGAMVNAIGYLPPAPSISNIHYHDYYKTARPGRKVGHITIHTDTLDARDAVLDELAPLMKSEALDACR